MSITLVAAPRRSADEEPIVLKPSLNAVAKPVRSHAYSAIDKVTLSRSLRALSPAAHDTAEEPERVMTQRMDKVQVSNAGRRLSTGDGVLSVQRPAAGA